MSKLLCNSKSNKILRNITLITPALQVLLPATFCPAVDTNIKQNVNKCHFSMLPLICNSLMVTRRVTAIATTNTIEEISKKSHNTSHHSQLSTMQKNIQRTFHRFVPVTDAPANVFRGAVDRFNGITVKSKLEFEPDVDFAAKLQNSIDYWKSIKRRAIWFEVQTEHCAWIPHLVKCDFDFHHARTGYVFMYRWLPENEYSNLPDYAHTMLGVAGLVINEQNEILVVSEKNPVIPDSWKLPGGFAEPRENIIDAAIREVREETGIESKFLTIVSFRHAHGGLFGTSDFYVVVGLTPLNSELQRCEREIAKLKWMPVDEYLQHPNVHETNRHFVRTFLDYQKRNICITCEEASHQILKKKYCLFYDIDVGDKQDSDTKDAASHL